MTKPNLPHPMYIMAFFRYNQNILLRDLAQQLGVPAYEVSAWDWGYKKIPSELFGRVIGILCRTAEEVEALCHAYHQPLAVRPARKTVEERIEAGEVLFVSVEHDDTLCSIGERMCNECRMVADDA